MTTSETLKTRASRISGFLGLQRSTTGVLAMVVLVGMGERMAERFLPIYILALGGGALAIGLLQAMDNLLSALYSFPGGYLSDRIGTRKSLLIFNLVAIAGFILVILVPNWQAVLIGAVLFISWSAISLPATMSLMYKVLPLNKRTMGVTMHSLVKRIPMAIGPLLGGLFIGIWGEQDGVRLAFGAALVMAVAALFLQQWMIEDDAPDKAAASDACTLTPEKNPLKLLRLMNPAMSGRPRHEKALRADNLCLFHPVSPGVAVQPKFRMAGPGFRPERAQGVRRAHPQGPDHGPVPGSLQGGHVRPVLPDSGCFCIPGRIRRGVLMANQPTDEPDHCVRLRDHRYRGICGFRP